MSERSPGVYRLRWKGHAKEVRFYFFEIDRTWRDQRYKSHRQAKKKKWSDEQEDEGVKVDCSTRQVQSETFLDQK